MGGFGLIRLFLIDVFGVYFFSLSRCRVNIAMFDHNDDPSKAGDDGQFIWLQSGFDAIHVSNKKVPTDLPSH